MTTSASSYGSFSTVVNCSRPNSSATGLVPSLNFSSGLSNVAQLSQGFWIRSFVLQFKSFLLSCSELRNTMKLASSLVPHQWRLLTSPQLSLQAFIFSTGTYFVSDFVIHGFVLPLSLSIFFSLHHKVSHFLVSKLASMSESSDGSFSNRQF
jgi:hypothetical protein